MIRRISSALVLCAVPALALSAPTALDGVIGAEWTGVTPKVVTYDANAPISNFQAPGTTNHVTGYEIFMRRDAQYLYAAVRTTGPTDSGGLIFANLYFSLRYGAGPFGSAGSGIGFEVTNDRAFKPGDPGYYNDTGANLIQWATFGGSNTDPDVLEAAIDLSVFTSNALGVANYGLPPGETALGVQLRLSQSFGYSVAGGADYGAERLGFVDLPAEVPEPGALMLSALALAGLAATRRRSSKGLAI
jgi:PEP-CTERM motif